MNGLISELIAAGIPMGLAFPLLLILALVMLIRAGAAAVAKVIKAMHPGESADAVAMQANRIRHRQWKLQRRDGNRRVHAARRALVRADVRARRTRKRTARYVDGRVTLPRLILSAEEPVRVPGGDFHGLTTR
ncbi:hypothetical protein ACH4D5_10095 [Streptomyces sp. NPDC018029]|uniref:hypothetical protein n=1 Tax=Streptomyces sp. NPDC018029 TaxID=3365032 RepID=UPI00378C0918